MAAIVARGAGAGTLPPPGAEMLPFSYWELAV